jgi:thioredoxin 1
MSDFVKEFTDENFATEVLSQQGPILVDFWAPWCGPCKMLAPTIDELAKDFDGKVVIGKLNTDNNPNTATTYGIMGIPTVLVFKSGQLVDKIPGLNNKARYQQVLEKHLS